MKRCLETICCLLGCVAAITAQDITNLEKIGPIVSFTTTQKAVTLTCWDNSQVQLTVLAADLVRVRTSFGKPIPSRDQFTTLGLSGQPFVGSDVGGFIGRGNGELLTRSYQVSFLAPFCRNHKVIDGYDQEPWRFGEHYEAIIRKYHRKYQGETTISVDAPLETVPMFVRAGAIIPTGPALNYVGEKPAGVLIVTL